MHLVIRISAYLFIFLLSRLIAFAQPCQEAKQLLNTLEDQHFLILPQDDSFSAQVFEGLIDRLDPGRHFFFNQDIFQLRRFKYDFAGAIATGSCTYWEELSGVYLRRIRSVDSLLAIMTNQALNYQVTLEPPFRFPDNQKEWLSSWEEIVKERILKRYYSQADRFAPEDWTQTEEEIRSQVIRQLRCEWKEVLAGDASASEYYAPVLFASITQCYDPHTSYFSARELQGFANSLAKESLSFGLKFKKGRAGELLIDRLAPGGPGWKSHALNQGDVLIAIQMEGEEALDLSCMDPYALEELMSSNQFSRMTMTVRKNSGQVKRVNLIKEKLEVEENVVTGYLMSGKIKAGYIYLPGFYTAWEDEGSQGCADDVARELLKLKLEGIEGLVLDLRNNGGGSISEALDLAGIFIREGPLCIRRGRGDELTLLKDANRGTAFDGPLVILVNGLSASASEMLAAALQDYNRAVILGSSTYGKASGQQVMPVQSNYSGPDPTIQPGFLKVTVQKFYRLTGESHQIVGVQADVGLPEPLGFLMPREGDEASVLHKDAINKETYYQALPSLPLQELRRRSHLRLQQDSRYRQVHEIGLQLEGLMTEPKALRYDEADFRKEKLRHDLIAKLERTLEDSTHQVFEVHNHQFLSPILEMDEALQEMNRYQLQKIQHDLYLEEAYYLLADMIELTHP